jgi:hypothetical protein
MNTKAIIAFLLLSTLTPQLSPVFAQGTAFTYQGRLLDEGAPADGTYNFEFTLYDSEGGVIDRPLFFRDMSVSNGLFTVALEFRGSVFPGADRWLGVAVSQRDDRPVALHPRQKITAAPYAITAGTVTGVIPPAALSGTYSGALNFSNAFNRFTGEIKITSGSPGEGKILMSDANGVGTWRSPSELSVFFGQNYSVLLPNVINNTTDLEISGVGTGSVVIVNGPGLQIERIFGFMNGKPFDLPGPNMEYPFVFECDGPLTNGLRTWHQQFMSDPAANRRSNSVIIRRLDGSEVGRWNLLQMGLTAITAGADGRHRYTLHHGLPPNNQFSYERTFHGLLTSSKNPATDTYRVEIEGVDQGGYPITEVDYTNRTMTLTFDYAESGYVYQWVREIAAGINYKKSMSLITESNGVEVSRRNFYDCFPISFQQTTGFGQVEKLKEQVVLSFDFWEDG